MGKEETIQYPHTSEATGWRVQKNVNKTNKGISRRNSKKARLPGGGAFYNKRQTKSLKRTLWNERTTILVEFGPGCRANGHGMGAGSLAITRVGSAGQRSGVGLPALIRWLGTYKGPTDPKTDMQQEQREININNVGKQYAFV